MNIIIENEDDQNVIVNSGYKLFDKDYDYLWAPQADHHESIFYNQNSEKTDNISKLKRVIGTKTPVSDGPHAGGLGYITFSTEENNVRNGWNPRSQPGWINYGTNQSGPTDAEV